LNNGSFEKRNSLLKNGARVNPFRFLDSDLPEWSESLIVLGRGIESWSRRYRARTHCVVAIGKISGLVRLYPVLRDDQADIFDVIQVVVRDEHPEIHRPESRKIYPHAIQVVAHEDEKEEQHNILKSLSEPGDFLHGEEWRNKTLGVIQPYAPHFWITKDNKVRVHYRCLCHSCHGNPSQLLMTWRPNKQEFFVCDGHTNEVLQLIKVDRVGRYLRSKRVELEQFVEDLRGKELYFVMGTLRNHPHRWILVTMHAFPTTNKKSAIFEVAS